MKRKFTYLLALAFAVCVTLSFTSCGDTLKKGIDFNSDKAGTELMTALTKHLDSDAIIYNILIENTEIDPFSYKVTTAVVHYSEPGSDEVKGMAFDFPAGTVTEASARIYQKRTIETGLKLSQLDFSNIPSFIKKANEITEEMDEKSAGIDTYQIVIKSDVPAEVVHTFELSVKEGTEVKGRDLITNYYTNFFNGYADGSVEYFEPEE